MSQISKIETQILQEWTAEVLLLKSHFSCEQSNKSAAATSVSGFEKVRVEQMSPGPAHLLASLRPLRPGLAWFLPFFQCRSLSGFLFDVEFALPR